jgi:hypothetical protein
MTAPLQLTDEEIAVLLDVARPIPWGKPREEFLAALAATLIANGEPGPGAIHRAARQLRGRYIVGLRQETEVSRWSRTGRQQKPGYFARA